MNTIHIQVVDSHTGGEPTRVVVEGGPDLGSGSVADRLAVFQSHYDTFRSAVVNEPRGSDVIIGALLVPPSDPSCTAGAIFFNTVGYLGMCGHGTIGLVASLAHLGRLKPGRHRIDTPVGVVVAELHPDASVSVENVLSYRLEKDVPVLVPGVGRVVGDIAWGGNWFFLVGEHPLELDPGNIEALSGFAQAIMLALHEQGIRGADGAPIDHVELFGPSERADSRNFVLCPGKAYDRSPCGTGTSAKLACLAADGKLAPGSTWRQESIIGSIFAGSYRPDGRGIAPTIQGKAWISGEARLLFEEGDPFAWGIPGN